MFTLGPGSGFRREVLKVSVNGGLELLQGVEVDGGLWRFWVSVVREVLEAFPQQQ